MLKAVMSGYKKDEALHGGYPLQVVTLGIGQIQEPTVRPLGIPLHQVFYCTGGAGELHIREDTYHVTEGCAFFLKENEPHSYSGLDEAWKLDFMGFSGSICASLLESLNLSESGAFRLQRGETFSSALRDIFEYIETEKEQDRKVLSVMCYSCLLEMSRDRDWILADHDKPQEETIQRIMAYLQKNFNRPVTLQDIANEVGLSKEYMCSYFKERMNQTIMHVLMDIRIMNACVLLGQYPEKRVKEIAGMCGFENVSYFCSVFRKHQGMSADAYRKRI